MDLGLQGAHVLVTGANGGIGFATAKEYLNQGANVSAHYRSSATLLDTLLKEYGPSRIQGFQADLTQEQEVLNIFEEANKAFGPVHIVIVNHAYFPFDDAPVASMTLERWNSTILTNLTSPFMVCRSYLQNLEKATEADRDRAAIVLIGSIAGKFGLFGHADYSSCKSALMYGLTLTMKNEIVKIAPKGRVNAIGPGWVDTPMVEQALAKPILIYRSIATVPLRKIAVPAEIAPQIVLISSAAVSGHVTGQVIMLDGGQEGIVSNMPGDIPGYP